MRHHRHHKKTHGIINFPGLHARDSPLFASTDEGGWTTCVCVTDVYDWCMCVCVCMTRTMLMSRARVDDDTEGRRVVPR